MKIDLLIDKGLTFNGNSIATRWSDNDPVKIRRTDDGIIVPSLKGEDGPAGGSTIDGITIKGSSAMIQTNPQVTQYIFSECAFHVIDHGTSTSASSYAVDTTQVKTIDEIRSEWNAPMDAGTTVNAQPYILGKNNFLQLRYAAHPSVIKNRWACAADSGNRHFGDTILAFFVIKDIQYGKISGRPSGYLNYLELTCLWSVLPEFVKGQVYTSGSKY